MDIDGESADMDMDMDGQFNIHGKSVPIVPCVKRIACCWRVRRDWRLQQQQFNLPQRTWRQTVLSQVLASYGHVLYLHPDDVYHAYQPSHRHL